MAFTPDGKTFATGGSASADPANAGTWEGIVKLWDTASGLERSVLKGHTSFVTRLKFSPNGKVLASATQCLKGLKWQIELKLWDIASGKELATLAGNGHYESVLEFTPDSKTLAWGIQGIYSDRNVTWEPEIKLIDVATGKELATLKGHTHGLKCLAFSPDGKTLASGGGLPPSLPAPDGKTRILGRKALLEEPGQVKLWDVPTGRERANLQGHTGCVLSMVFSPDGKMLASGGAGTPTADHNNFWYWSGEVKMWDVATGKERVSFRGHPSPRSTVECVTFSGDGTRLASAGGNTVKLWDTATGREQFEVTGDQSDTWLWVAFKGNGIILLSRRPEPAKIFGAAHEEIRLCEVAVIK